MSLLSHRIDLIRPTHQTKKIRRCIDLPNRLCIGSRTLFIPPK